MRKSTDLRHIVELIRSRLLLSDIVGKDVRLKRNGDEFVGICPFHKEKTGSFFVNDKKCGYYCFGCGAKGDIVKYVMESKNLNFIQAVKELAEIAGIKVEQVEINKHDNNLEKYAEQFAVELLNNKNAIRYLFDRGVDMAMIKKFKIGYYPANMQYDTKILSTGFNNRIIFPVFTKSGRIVGFGGRVIDDGGIRPKYLNSAESDEFKKKELLYGIYQSIANCKSSPLILVEGYMDVILMHQAGFNTAVATMGTAASEFHLMQMWQLCDEPIVCFDGDDAGKRAMVRIAKLALNYLKPGKSLRFCELPDGYDPDSYVRNFSASSMREILNNTTPLIDFLWNIFVTNYNNLASNTPEQVAAWEMDIDQTISNISNANIRYLYKRDIKNKIFWFLRQRTGSGVDVGQKITKKTNFSLDEAILLYAILKRPSIVGFVAEKASRIDFKDEGFASLCCHILDRSDTSDLDLDRFDKTIKRLESIGPEYYISDKMSDDDVVKFWNDVFDNGVLARAYERDLQEAFEECKQDCNEKTWQRLKAIKMHGINKKLTKK